MIVFSIKDRVVVSRDFEVVVRGRELVFDFVLFFGVDLKVKR